MCFKTEETEALGETVVFLWAASKFKLDYELDVYF